MIKTLIWRGTFSDRFEDKAHAIAVFNAHIAEVKRMVPPERLLVFEVKEGWAPLCQFLHVPVPTTPFPHVNDTAEFKQRAETMGKRVRTVKAVSFAAGAALVATSFYFLLRRK